MFEVSEHDESIGYAGFPFSSSHAWDQDGTQTTARSYSSSTSGGDQDRYVVEGSEFLQGGDECAHDAVATTGSPFCSFGFVTGEGICAIAGVGYFEDGV
jgi:hypothetical protein